jgi:hypothetical protein
MASHVNKVCYKLTFKRQILGCGLEKVERVSHSLSVIFETLCVYYKHKINCKSLYLNCQTGFDRNGIVRCVLKLGFVLYDLYLAGSMNIIDFARPY